MSSEGHRIAQVIVHTGAGMDATAVGETETQRRSYPRAGGQYGSGGYELVRRLDLVGNAPRVAAEAAALLDAPPCPAAVTDVILEGSQVALQIHESVGHATEVDRILGWEAAFAGTSFLDPAQLGRLRYGSELMHVTADATVPGALGTFGFDDEGTPARRRRPRARRHLGRRPDAGGTAPPSSAWSRAGWSSARASAGCRWCG